MKMFFLLAATATASVLFAKLPEPIVHFDYTGDVIKAGGKYEEPKLPATVSIAEGKQALAFHDKGEQQLTIPNSSDISLVKGGAVYVLVHFDDDSIDVSKKEGLDMVLFKDKEFLLGRARGKVYFNGGNGKDWKLGVSSEINVPAKQWVAIAATVNIHPTAGHRVAVFINGKRVAYKWYPFKTVEPGKSLVTIGKGWGGPWAFKGKIGKIMIFDKPLTDAQVAELSADEAYLKN